MHPVVEPAAGRAARHRRRWPRRRRVGTRPTRRRRVAAQPARLLPMSGSPTIDPFLTASRVQRLSSQRLVASRVTRLTDSVTLLASICKVSIGDQDCRRASSSARTSSVCWPSSGARRTRRPRRAVEIRRRRDHRHGGFSVRHVDDAAGGVELLVGDDVLEGVDRRPEEVRFAGEDLRPLVERLGREDLDPARRSARRR